MTPPPRVLLLVENNGYPADFRVRREALALRDAGYCVSVVAPREPNQRWTECIDEIAVYRFPAPPGGHGLLGYVFEFGYSTLALFLLASWVALRKGVDVIHAANPPDTLFVIGAIFKLFGKKYVFDQHDLAPEVYQSRFSQPHNNLIVWILRLIEHLSYAIADVVIVTNESYRRIAIERGRKDPDQVHVVRNGPPLSYRPLQPEAFLSGRARYLIGYIGTIGPQDGLDYLLRSLRRLVFDLKRTDVLAIVIGDGDALSSAKTLAKQLDIESHVHFTGRLAEVEARQCLSATTVCVQPDPLSPLNDKSTMNKLMEYMALSKPVVAFDLVETRFSAQGAAIYVKPNDEQEFAEKLNWLLDHPVEREKMGETGRQRVAGALAWEYSIPPLLDSYRQILEVAPRPKPES